MKSMVAFLVLIAAGFTACRQLPVEPKQGNRAARGGDNDRPPKMAFRDEYSSYGSSMDSMTSSYMEDYWRSSYTTTANTAPPQTTTANTAPPQTTTAKPPVVNPTSNPPTTGGCQCGQANSKPHQSEDQSIPATSTRGRSASRCGEG
ncbi:uncharacterized protein LOC122242736 [Penaeus japonicus]|uniref:uncharacterized protein LOC122242736 n=1 Tax=Penaeus japonicus TaxID=27405 RepID=UPI001C70CDC1|nr:uncharacterized protein LOC122242736 [Penaeus japonicus]